MTLGRLAGCLAFVLLGFAACASPVADIQPGQRPALDTDEAGLWMAMDRAEKALKTSGNRVRDEALNEYVSGIVCKLAGSYCPDIRIYLVRVPYFNASMAPNGTMQVWTGLILRTRNEAQLATVLGHEIAHYLRRHSLQMWQDARSKTNVLIFFQIATAAAGVALAGNAASLIALGSILAYSREHEREADSVGLKLLAKAGYDPREASKIWEQLIREEKTAEDKKSRPLFFASHPPPEERNETLKRLAAEAMKDGLARTAGQERFRAVFLPHRGKYLRDELHVRRFSRTEELLNILLEDGANVGELRYFQGELYRLRGKEGDRDKALDAYRKALASGGTPPEIHRSMGLIYLKSGESDKARASFSKYLELRPDASDREMIRSLMQQIG